MYRRLKNRLRVYFGVFGRRQPKLSEIIFKTTFGWIMSQKHGSSMDTGQLVEPLAS